ncbi:DNA-binding transcriptional regulator RamA [Kosakonia radicincitans DSM 16656]|uniref:AraC family transcriptional regulator, mar-sox-rob regulon activator n=1 Tax=Kosakonia radicincitans TaxID=283686 RepID=A0AAX2EYB6_9ENTR|nr:MULTISPECIES: helix-turn-helix domain-containing protein [Kosakonia]MDP9568382.1 AraC family mar-sox-rob regulon transcriptional activator/AraC family multidrug resistance transcriptional activator [Kosakonia oryzae]APG18738.1 transcriptional regulator [Kosakonia radicincitans]ARD60124.1 DNA-binding transcriptional regulator RamA [Kosakonia radicincitans DSM 16656]KDE34792.1 transcriptional regulator [Kosakonia radicincitans UMEnt01/12]MDD7993647.1 helix-turn-helix domain-containing protein
MNHRKELIINLIAWINRNIQSPMKIDDVAAKSGYSKWHLQRLFFAETGQNLGQFIRDRKLSLIAEQLITSNESLISLAMKYGFDSQQSLTRAFHKKYQLPPHKYRKTFFRQHFDDFHTDVKPRKSSPASSSR